MELIREEDVHFLMGDQVRSSERPRDDIPSASEAVAKFRLELSHRPLEELVEEGLVKLGRENNVVQKGPDFEKGRPLRS